MGPKACTSMCGNGKKTALDEASGKTHKPGRVLASTQEAKLNDPYTQDYGTPKVEQRKDLSPSD